MLKTNFGLKSLWRMFAMLLCIALIFQSTHLTVLASDDPNTVEGVETTEGNTGTPAVGEKTTEREGDSEESAGGGNGTNPGEAIKEPVTSGNGTAPGEATGESDTSGSSTDPGEATGEPATGGNNTDSEADFGDPGDGVTPPAGADAQEGDPSDPSAISEREENASDSTERMNGGANDNIITAGTQITIAISGMGLFTDAAKADPSYQYNDEAGTNTFTYTVPRDMGFTELLGTRGVNGAPGILSQALSPYMTSVGNLSFFNWWFSAEWTEISTVAVLNSTPYIIASFINYYPEYSLSPSGSSKTVRRININDGPQTFTFSLRVFNEETGVCDQLPTGVRFGDWEVEPPASGDAPYTIEFDPSNPERVTICPQQAGEAFLTLPLLSTAVTDERVYTCRFRIIIEEDNTVPLFPEGRGITVHIEGKGRFTDDARASGNYQSGDGWEYYDYAATRDMTLEEVLQELSPLTEPADDVAEFIGWFTDGNIELAHVDQLISDYDGIYQNLYARYDNGAPAEYIPAGTEIPISIEGPGVFTQAAKTGTGGVFDSENYTFIYTCEEDMDYQTLLSKLSPYTAPAGNFGQFGYMVPEHVGNNGYGIPYDDFLSFPRIIINYQPKPYNLEMTPHSANQSLFITNEPGNALELSADLYLTDNYYRTRLSTPITGVTLGDWCFAEGAAENIIAIENDPSQPGKAVLTPLAVGSTRIMIPFEVVDGDRHIQFNSDGYTVHVTDAGKKVLLMKTEYGGIFTDAARNDPRFSDEYQCFYYTMDNQTEFVDALQELSSFVEPIGNITELDGFYVERKVGNSTYRDKLISSDQLSNSTVVSSVYPRFTTKPIAVTRSDGRPMEEPLYVRSDTGQELSLSYTLKETGEPLTGVTISMYQSYTGTHEPTVVRVTGEQVDNRFNVTVAPGVCGKINLQFQVTGTGMGRYMVFDTAALSVEVMEPFAFLSYEAYAGTEEVPFYSANSAFQTAASKTMVLQDAYAEGYAFEGWYLAYDHGSGVFSEPLTDSRFTNTDELEDTTFYAKFKKIVPVASLTFSELPPVLEANPDDVYLLDGMISATPDDHTDTFTFTTSNANVASVVQNNEGEWELTAKSPGTAVITARSAQNPNITATASLQVVKKIKEPAQIAIQVYSGNEWKSADEMDWTLLKDNGMLRQARLRAVVTDENGDEATFRDVEWVFLKNDPADPKEIYDTPVYTRATDAYSVPQDGKDVISISEDGVLTLRPYDKTYQFHLAAVSLRDPDIRCELRYGYILKPYRLSFVNLKGTVPKAGYVNESTYFIESEYYHNMWPDGENLLVTEPTAKGYTFGGWYEDINDESTKCNLVSGDPPFRMPSRDVVLTAKWISDEKGFTAHYGFGNFGEGDGEGADYGEVADENGFHAFNPYTVDDGMITLPDVEIEGYDFLGWYADKACKTKITKPVAASAWKYTDVYCVLKRAVESVVFAEKESRETIVLHVGEKGMLDAASVTPALASGHDYTLTYTSSKNDVATVNADGEVTAKKAGTTVIRASAGGKSDTYTVQVIAKTAVENEPATIIIGKPKGFKNVYDADKDKQAALTFTASVRGTNNKNATVQTVKWTIVEVIDEATDETRETTFATVNGSGKVTLNLAGVGSEGALLRVIATSAADKEVQAHVNISVERRYNLTFETRFGKAPATQRLKAGEFAKTVADLSAKGYIFDGWYLKGSDPDVAASLSNGNSFSMPDEHSTMVAKWTPVTVKLNFLYGFNNVEGYPQDKTDVEIPYGTKPSENLTDYLPLVPDSDPAMIVTNGHVFRDIRVNGTDTHYRFLGWYTDAAKTKAFNVNAAVTPANPAAPVSVYAKTQQVFKVSFDLHGEGDIVNYPSGTIEPQFKRKGEKVIQPVAPVRAGYRFAGWYKTAEQAAAASASPSGNAKTKINFATALGTLNDDSTVYHAAWYRENTEYILSYEVDKYTNLYGTFDVTVTNRSSFGDITLSYHDDIIEPGEPEATGFNFTGWYADANRTVPFVFPQRITKNTTVYAGWSTTQVNVTLYRPAYDAQTGRKDMVPRETFLVDYGTPVPLEKIRLSYFQDQHLKECRIHDDTIPDVADRALYDLAAPVTLDLHLDLIYHGEYEAGVPHTPSPLSNLSVLTNSYTRLDDVGLPEHYEWAEPEKPLSAYAGKGVVAVKVNYTGSYKDYPLTIPVRFYTVTGLKLYLVSQTASLLPGRSVRYDVQPVLKGAAASDYNASFTASTYLKSLYNEDRDRLTLVSNHAAISGIEDPGSYGASSYLGVMFSFDEKKAVKTATKATVTCKLYEGPGKVLSGTANVNLLPYSDGTGFLNYGDLFLFFNGMRYTSDATIGLNEATEGKLTIKGEYTGTKGTVTVTGSNQNVIVPGKVTKKIIDKASDIGSFEVPLTVKGPGTVSLKITLTNAAKTLSDSRFVTLTITDPETRLLTKSVSLNKNKYGGQTITLTPAYGDTLNHLAVDSVTPEAAIKKQVDEALSKHWFVPEARGHNTYEIRIDEHADISKIPAGTYTLKLSNHGTPIKQALTVKVVSAQPSVTIKQAAALNLKNTADAGATQLKLTSNLNAGEYITAVTVTGTNGEFSPYLHVPEMDEIQSLYTGTEYYTAVGVGKTAIPGISVTSKTNKNITLEMTVSGYRTPVKKIVTLNITDQMPAVQIGNNTATFYEKIGDGFLRAEGLKLRAGGKIINDLAGWTITPDSKLSQYYEFEVEERVRDIGYGPEPDDVIRVTAKQATGNKTVSGTVTVSNPALYEKTANVSFKVTIAKTTAFKPSLSPATIRLNRNAPGDAAVTYLKSNGTGMFAASDVEIVPGAGVTVAVQEKLDVYYDETAGAIIARWTDNGKGGTRGTLAAGNYKYSVRVATAYKTYPLTLTISVVNIALNKTVTVTQRSNYFTAKNPLVTLDLKMANLNGRITDICLGGKDAVLFHGTCEDKLGCVNANAVAHYSIAGHAYDVTVASVTVTSPDGRQTIVPVNKKLNMQRK